MNSNQVWIVNGVISKVEGNFIPSNFEVHKVGETGLSFGSCPMSEQDLQSLSTSGVKTIVNLMTDDEVTYFDLKMKTVS